MAFASNSENMFMEQMMLDEEDDFIDLLFLDLCRQYIQLGQLAAEELNAVQHKDSVTKRKYISRDHAAAHLRLYNDYFDPTHSGYDANTFRRRFRMRPELFDRIMHDVVSYDPKFEQKFDSSYKAGSSTLTKVTACILMLAYGCQSSALDDYLKMGQSTVLYYLKRFCDAVIDLYGEEYLGQPTVDDMKRMMEQNEKRGFPGMVGSLDCMHWQWNKNGQSIEKERFPTLVLEAVADCDLWIWHACFALPTGSPREVNVSGWSPLFSVMPAVEFEVNGKTYKQPYYLANDMYPPYANCVKSIPNASTETERVFVRKQEAARKDVERAFAALQARFAMITRPPRFLKGDNLAKILKTCILLHNMIIQDERHVVGLEDAVHFENHNINKIPAETPSHDLGVPVFADFLRRYSEPNDTTLHDELTRDLGMHIQLMDSAMDCDGSTSSI